MGDYQVQLERFQGPMALLLELVEQQKLAITDISLSRITESFLQELEQVRRVAPHEVADFLVVAGRLLYLKSKLLIPSLELEEEEEGSLVRDLQVYQRFAQAARVLEAWAARGRELYAGVRQQGQDDVQFVPPNVEAADLAAALRAAVDRARPYVALPQVLLERTVSVEQRIDELRERIRSRATVWFKELHAHGSRADVVTSFLALLELLKQNVLRAEQSSHFEEIALTRV